MRWLSLLLLLFGCGEALVTADFRGEPLFTIEGRAADWRYSAETADEMQVAIFWSLTGETTVEPSQLVEMQSVETSVRFPSIFKINVFAEPDDPRLVQQPYVVGEILAYVDENGDGEMSPGELRGGASRVGLLFAPQAVPADRSPTRSALRPGFTQVNLPLDCTAPPVEFIAGGETCGVPLGGACASDGDCGTGECLTTDGFVTFPGGYCSLSERSACQPDNGIVDSFFFLEPGSLEEPEFYYYLLCSSDADCRDGYECAFTDTCLPEEPVFIDITPDFMMTPVCFDFDW